MSGNNIVDPSMTATADRTGVITGSVVGTGYNLSPFFATVSLTEGTAASLRCQHSSTSAPCLHVRPSQPPIFNVPASCLCIARLRSGADQDTCNYKG